MKKVHQGEEDKKNAMLQIQPSIVSQLPMRLMQTKRIHYVEGIPIETLVRYSLIRFNNVCHLIRDGDNGAMEISSTFQHKIQVKITF